MTIYDISVPISPTMPVWPGDPAVVIERVSQIEAGDNANVSRLALSAHTGTHVDAPYHFLAKGVTLEQIPLDLFVGPADVIELPAVEMITAAELAQAIIPAGSQRVLFKTRNSAIWARGVQEFQTDFVALEQDAAQYLVDRGVKLVGIDYLSVAPFKNSRPTHEVLLQAGVVILEGVNLSEVLPGRYQLYCLPLKLQAVDGAPARAILVDE
ncbi:MAG: cyclase family protein [Anaerolineales bacterium]|nr:cyclase family protein [Anaerolineales bacterium]